MTKVTKEGLWNGLPVASMLITDSAYQALGQHTVRDVLEAARDTATGPGEPTGWYFEAVLDGQTYWVHKGGGVLDTDTGEHEDANFTVLLPSEH